MSKGVQRTETKLNAVFMKQQILTDRQQQVQQEHTHKQNARFAAMQPAQQAVALAREVVNQLKTEKLKARAGTYLAFPNDITSKDAFVDDVFREPGSCTVCALGSIFICAAIKIESLRFDDFNYVDGDSQVSTTIEAASMRNVLKAYFPYNQLCLIEIAFEGVVGVDMNLPTAAESDAGADALAFREGKFNRDGEALLSIMKNIIKNKGTFKP